ISISEISRDSYTGRYHSFLPQADVTWGEANTFAGNFGKKFRLNTGLPTEAQWEYAARSGGQNIEYPWGSGISCSKANYRDCGNRVKAATVFFPNSYGIYDMAGNLREWCRDAYDEQAYLNTAYKDPYISSGGSGRVVRGGSYADGPLALKTYTRYWRSESQKDAFTGFRIVIQGGR
ncbi:MAG: SUMF1/EgtB/PvdO family nonheme iron enzyme, partial [Candidatus Aminicenantes bacterium]|nr:SUMF1/EgtB/PvdO family nonheme iron enzyme [Candidatus Aminicenantes bacterium]